MQTKKLPIKIALIVSSITTVCLTAVITPILANVQMSFPDVSPSIVNLTSTVPALLIIPSMLLAGKLGAVFSKKTVLIIGMLLFTVGGVCAGLVDNIYFVIIMRAVTGLGAGLCSPTVTAIVSDYFQGPEVPATMGQANAFDSCISIAFGLIAGVIAVTNWRYAFFLYGFGIIALILEITCLPKVKSDKEMAKEMAAAKADMPKEKIDSKLAFKIGAHAFMLFILGVFGTPFLVGVARFCIQEQIGNSAIAGIIMAANGVASFVVSLLFGKIYKGMKKYTVVAIFIVNILFALCLYFAHGLVLVILAAVFFGLGLGTMMPYFTSRAAMMAPVSSRTLVIGIIICCLSLGQFVGGFVSQWIQAIFHADSMRTQFGIIAIIFAVFTVIVLIYTIATKEEPMPMGMPPMPGMPGPGGPGPEGAGRGMPPMPGGPGEGPGPEA